MADSKKVLEAKIWVTQELNRADANIRYLEDSDPRGSGTIEGWRNYRCELRDYVKGGEVSDERPSYES